MITLRKAVDRGHADHGWLKTAYTFSFADYHDPQHMGFRSLRVINDDIIAGGGGFPTHAHRDMEIITYMLEGALQHRDSMGNGSVIRPGNVQYMAAGSGVRHSEFNASDSAPAHLLQIWIRPDRSGVEPRYQEKSLGLETDGRLGLVASRDGREGSIQIHQDADLWIGRFQPGETASHAIRPGRHVWLHTAVGHIHAGTTPLGPGDALATSDESSVTITAVQPAQVLLFDLA